MRRPSIRSPRGGGWANRSTGRHLGSARAGFGTSAETDRERWTRRIDELDDAPQPWRPRRRGVVHGHGCRVRGDLPRRRKPPGPFGGDEARETGRRPIANVIDAEGSFLGPGRANRHLLKCLVEWAPCRIEPYGLDLSPALAKLARRRVPHWADRIFVGNALTWEPPMRFDVVRTALVYVPDDLRQAYLERLLARVGPRPNVNSGPYSTSPRRTGPRSGSTNVAAGNVSTASGGTSQPTRCSTTTSGRRKRARGRRPRPRRRPRRSGGPRRGHVPCARAEDPRRPHASHRAARKRRRPHL